MKNNIRNFKNKFSLFLSFLFLFQLILFNSNNTAFAATTPSVSYTTTGDTKVGGIINIAVNVNNIADLYGGSIDFVYDKSLIEVQSVSKGNIFGSNKVTTILGENGKIQNGQASFTVFLNGNKPGVTANTGTLAIIKAKVLKEGTVKLNTTSANTPALSLAGNTIKVKLSDSKAKNIVYTANNKNISLGNSIPVTSYEENNSLIKYSGNWVNEAVSSNSGSNAKFSNSTNASFTFSFEGTGFKWYGLANNYKGIANVYIDGVKQTVDTYSSSTVYKKLFLEKSGLTNGKHTVKIEVSGKKNASSKGTYIHIDKLDILNGKLIETNTGTVTSYEENNSLIKYSGSWVNEAVSSNSGSNAKFSNSTNASFTFSFEGTGFRWYGLANNYKGIANVYIDGVKQTVDTYSSSTVYKKLFLEKSGLSNGKHTVKIEVSGNKNASSKGTYVHIDKLDILNGKLIETNTGTVTSYEENNSLIKYSGSWVNEAVSSNSGSNAKFSNSTNASFTFSFEGTGFRWYGLANNYKGIANVYIDGVKQTVDTYSSSTVYKKLFLEKSGLSNGKHTVKIEVSGNKNASSKGTYVHIDKLDILNGKLIETNTGTTTSYEENNSLIKYSGNWVNEAVSSNSGSNAKFSNSTNASFTFSFEGTGFRWYGLANNYKGIANVYIDGVKQTVDTYSSSTVYKKLFLEKSGLSNGKHTVKIEVSGNKNASSKGTYVHIDKLDILNGKLIETNTGTTTSYEENNSLIKYSGNWVNEAVSSNSGSNAKFSNSTNASFTFSFEGTGFRWYGLANNYKGIANVYIDGVKQTVDTYSSSTVYKKLFLEKSGLSNGKHTVKIEVSGNKNASSKGTYVHIDKLDILNGKLIETNTGTTTSYEENNSLIKYSGNWVNEAVSSNSGSNAKFSNSTNASFTFSFEGTGFRWYGLANNYKGIANVYIDGVKQTVDTYSSSTVYKKLFLEKSGLSNGKHTVKIEVSGNKNASSKGTYVHIDKLDILNGKLIK